MSTYVSDSGKTLVLSEDTARYQGADGKPVQLELVRAKFLPPGNRWMTTKAGDNITATSTTAEYKGEIYTRVPLA